MLEVTIILNPFGMGENKRELSTVKIANIKTNVDGTCDYVYLISEPKSPFGDEVSLDGVIYKHDRKQPVSVLVKKVYEDFGKSACKVSQEYAGYFKQPA